MAITAGPLKLDKREKPMRLHDERLDQDLHREIDLPVFPGPTDKVAPPLDISVEPVDASVDGQGGTIRDKPVFTIEQVIQQLNRGGAGWTPGNIDHAVPRDGDVSVLNFGFHTADSMFAEPYVFEEDGVLYGRPNISASRRSPRPRRPPRARPWPAGTT